MMTKKHFEAVAAALGPRTFLTHYDTPAETAAFACGQKMARVAIASDLAQLFKRENPKFDRERFMRACGFGD